MDIKRWDDTHCKKFDHDIALLHKSKHVSTTEQDIIIKQAQSDKADAMCRLLLHVDEEKRWGSLREKNGLWLCQSCFDK